MNQKIQKYHDKVNIFRCPICHGPFSASGNTLTCSLRHSFDIARKGYVNFLSGPRNLDGYSQDSFVSRNTVMENGMYEHILEKINELIVEFQPESIIDIGTGNGYFLNNLITDGKTTAAGLDFSKDAVNIAARGINDRVYMVADINDIPVKDGSFDMILNLYTPSNYPEFRRILKSDGIIIKAVPTEEHMKELRSLIRGSLKNGEYSNVNVIKLFEENTSLIMTDTVSKTFETDAETAGHIIKMSPMMFNRNGSEINLNELTSITVSAEILVGRIK